MRNSFWVPSCFFLTQLLAQTPGAPILSDAAQTEPAERLALLQPVCGTHANENGCSTCPPGTDFPNDQLSVTGIVYGHFLGPHSDDAAVGFSGCESHASGLGGALLLSRQDGVWKLVSLRPAAIVEDCKKLQARDGGDVLICYGTDGHQGVQAKYLYLLDFKKPWDPEAGLDIFLMVTDSADTCTLIYRPQKGLVSGVIDRVSFDREGRRITVEARLGCIPLARFKAVEKECLAPDVTPIGLRIATINMRYAFAFDGTKITSIPGNPPMERNETIAPETHALRPTRYVAPDRSFAIPVPYTFRTIANPRSSSSPVCGSRALVCLLYPPAPQTQAAVEISIIEGGAETSCLNPEHLPGRSSHFVPGTYGYARTIGGVPGKYGFWTGLTAQYRLDQSVIRVWRGAACYQVAANIAHERNASESDDSQIGQDLMNVIDGFGFLKPH